MNGNKKWKSKRGYIISILLFFIVLILAFIWLIRPMDDVNGKMNLHSSDFFIAHAGGGVNGSRYTNSKEALLNSLDLGYKYIELDLYMTEDSDVICLHSMRDYELMTGISSKTLDSKTFKKTKLFGVYTPMTLNEAIDIWHERPFYFVVDKISDPNILNKYFTNNRERVMVEAFSYDHYTQLEKDGYIPMMSVKTDFIGMIKFFFSYAKSGFKIKRVCMAVRRLKFFPKIFKRMGLNVAVWSINDTQYIEEHLGKDVDMIYTDYWMIYNSL